jgi:hypothetical protein
LSCYACFLPKPGKSPKLVKSYFLGF